MTQSDFLKIVNDVTLKYGTVWPLPVVYDVDEETAADSEPNEDVLLQSPDGDPIGV